MALSVRIVRIGALAAILLIVLSVAVFLAPAPAAAETAANASGRYDTLVLRDLGGKQAALVQLIAEDGAFIQRELWRSKKGAFDTRRATFVAGDVNGDGIGDGIVLYDLGKSRSRLLVFLSDGTRARQTTAWTSRPGAFAKSKARIAVGDVNGDGLDDVIALCARGQSGATLYRFVSTGAKFRQSTGWSARSGYAWSRTQLAAGDVNGDGRDDAIVLYKRTNTSSHLDVFVSGSSRFSKKAFWSGSYPAGRATLAAGDVDSDGDCDVVCLRSGRLEVFRSSGRSFSKPATWATGAPATSLFGVGDITGDGRGDVVTGAAAGSAATRFTVWVSSGSAFAPQTWWQGAWPASRVRLGVAPSPGTIISDRVEPLDRASRRHLRMVNEDASELTFAGRTGQLARLEAGDVLVAAPSATFPEGLCRKVAQVTEASGQVVVQTVPATLTEVIDQGEVAFNHQVTAADLSQEHVTRPGVRLITDDTSPGVLPRSLRGGVTAGFGFDMTTTVAGIAEIEGSVWLDPEAYVDWDIGLTGLQSAAYTQTLRTTTDLTVSLKKALDKEIKQVIYKQTLGVITIMVGPVPVVVTPEFEVYVGAKGEVTAGVTAGMSLGTEAVVGLSYQRGSGWSTTKSFTYDLTPKPPQLFGSLELKGFAGAGLAFKIYAVAGPTAKVEPYVKLKAATNAVPWWTLKAGVDAKVGFKVEALDITVVDHSATLHLFEYLIDQAGSSSGATGSDAAFQVPSVSGKVLDAATSQPVRSAWVEARRQGSTVRETYVAGDGSYLFWGLPAGEYTVVAGRDGYADNQRSVTVTAGVTVTGQNVQLTRSAYQGIEGHVYHAAGGLPMFQARVELYRIGEYRDSYTSNYTTAGGYYKLEDLEPGTYRLTASDLYDWYYFKESVTVTVTGGQLLTRDFRLVGKATQGVSGCVVETLTGDPLAGVIVRMRDSDEEDYIVEEYAVTEAGGSFAVTGLPVGTYWLVASKPGYEDKTASFTVTRGAIRTLGNVVLKPIGGQSMRAPDQGAWIRWEEGVSSSPRAYYEFWFRPTAWGGMEYGNVLAEISHDYSDWHGQGPHRWPAMRIHYGSAVGSPDDTVICFGMNENTGDDFGTWHRLVGTTPVQLGRWYHIGAQYGSWGMMLFVNGHLEAFNDYTGAPQANPGAEPGGWFSLGGNDTFPGHQTAMGDYRGVAVGEEQRWLESFTAPEPSDGPLGYYSPVVLDDMIGMTNGENGGFVPTP